MTMLKSNTVLTIFLLFAVYVDCYIVNPGPKVIATKGAIWPKPQYQESSQDYFVLRPAKFKFVLSANSSDCSLLKNAFTRYWKILQQNTLPRTKKLLHAKSGKLKKTYLPEGNNLGYLDQLTVSLEGACNDNEYPSINMEEKYHLTVTTEKVELLSISIWGILRGLETFSQLLYLGSDRQTIRVNSTFIIDYPRYKHRGLLLDTARHYIPMKQIYQILDGLAYNKMNVFHWHLVDDQSFPFVSQKFPELSELGAYEPELFIYTPEDVQNIIEYCRQRGIRVMPEIDTPGHTRSWGNSHPEILTNCSTIELGAYGPLDPSKNATYLFLGELLSEIRHVFVDQFIHLGGDEVDFDCWGNDTNIVKFMKKNHIETLENLEEYYIQNVINIADNLKFNSIVWEEVFVNRVELPDDTIVHVWRNFDKFKWNETMYNITIAGKQGLLSACWYLDHLATGGDWQQFYSCDPTNFNGTKDQYKLIIGGEACMWGEVVNEYNVVSRIWPRASAPAEKLWSAYNPKYDVNEPARRLEEHACRMNRRGIPAQPPNSAGFCI